MHRPGPAAPWKELPVPYGHIHASLLHRREESKPPLESVAEGHVGVLCSLHVQLRYQAAPCGGARTSDQPSLILKNGLLVELTESALPGAADVSTEKVRGRRCGRIHSWNVP